MAQDGRNIAYTGKWNTFLTQAVTPGTATIDDGDAIGGLLTFNAMGDEGGDTGIVAQVKLVETADSASVIMPAIKLFIADETFTPVTEGSAFVLPVTSTHVVDCIEIAAADWVKIGAKSAVVRKEKLLNYIAADGALYAQLIAAQSITFNSAATIHIELVPWRN